MAAESQFVVSPAMRPAGEFSVRVMRRHVDLVRVSSALCPASTSH